MEKMYSDMGRLKKCSLLTFQLPYLVLVFPTQLHVSNLCMVVNDYIIIYFYIKHLNPVKSSRTFNVFYKYNVGLLYVKYDYFIQYAINKGTITAQISFIVLYIVYLPIYL